MTKARRNTARLSAGTVEPAADVLVVDDDAALREGAVEALALAGIVAVGAANGAEALRFLVAGRADLILLDLRMPVLDGWAFLRHRAGTPGLLQIPVLLLSGEPLDNALLAFVDGWLSKPFSEGELIDAVNKQLQRIHHLPSTLARRPAPPAVMRKHR
jgi:CheY-like chemotaxis protein